MTRTAKAPRARLSSQALATIERRQRDGRRRRGIRALVAVIVAAALAGGIALATRAGDRSAAEHVIPAQGTPHIRADYYGTRDGTTVLSGGNAPHTLDLYADFLCPQCGRLHKALGTAIEQATESGRLQVRYHMVPLLVDFSNPAGYSLDAANAALCAADAGTFLPFHASLFADQPKEGRRGYDRSQLTDLGHRLGITNQTFDSCVTTGAYDARLRQELTRVSADPALQQPGARNSRFGTPTAVADGTHLVDLTTSDWLDRLLAS
ncbi:thioredoxin domain-containing protein [Kitasatospora sp. NPDC097691]|uniref:DsbA family protein n=1 Tax=Kitasatospora sp. NPDC097691 TaxID=3157231 RepID=UPI00331D582D